MNLELASKTVLVEENNASTSASINVDDVVNGKKTDLLENVSTLFYWIT